MNVINLHTGEPSSLAENSELVRQLEELLAGAQAGTVTAMGMAVVNADGTVSTRWSGGDQTIPMCAAIAMLHHDFMSGMQAWNGGAE